MKKQLLFLLIIVVNINCYSQISFQKGYYIDNSGQKIDCQIKNIDWKNNPTEFEYRLSEDTEHKKITIKSVKEFGVYDILKYRRHVVMIERSSNAMNKLSTSGNLTFKEEEIFLKVVIEGKASLYSFEDKNVSKFFYSVDNSEVKQLIFKKYLTPENKININNRYRQQLWSDLKCKGISMNTFKNVDYYKNELKVLFKKYNTCNNSESINFENKQKRDLFNLTVRLGLNSSSLSIRNDALFSSYNMDFDNKLGFRLGVEAEFILPFNKNKWAVLVEPKYQYYKSENERILNPNTVIERTEQIKVDYKSLEIPIGIRHYMFLSENSKLFINSSFAFVLNLNSNITFEHSEDLDIQAGSNLTFGLGYKYNDKYSLECRYGLSHDILNDYADWSSDYKTLSIIFGYSIF
ncbi:outer membrane beta-barrel protein [Aquimarina sp. AU58]|uniref:outer membrane beta-barrel protein n=1 Tax=Aquimarina sp. AU58 TaxID=1874112 RepID=UPI000D6E0376|nr:outer membrane beta-barrel protein [Aquimarina sp. AU58]